MTEAENPLRWQLFREMSQTVEPMAPDQALEYLKETIIVATTGLTGFGPQITLQVLASLTRYVLTSNEMVDQADAQAEKDKGVTLQ